VLSRDRVEKYYRFYGARHSILQVGYLIDFEVEESGSFLPRIRSISHIGFKWLYNREKLFIWHRFISIFEPHLRDVTQIDPIYYETLLECVKKWHLQSPKRLIVESYIKILKHEGRLQPLDKCLICNQSIDKNIAFVGKFIPAHPSCVNQHPIRKESVEYLLNSFSSIWLNDEEIERLYLIALKGF